MLKVVLLNSKQEWIGIWCLVVLLPEQDHLAHAVTLYSPGPVTGRRPQQTFNNGDFLVTLVKYVIWFFFFK